MKTSLEIEITNVEVEGRWYTVNYTASYKGKEYKEEINDDHCWEPAEWLEDLTKGGAETMAFCDFTEKHF